MSNTAVNPEAARIEQARIERAALSWLAEQPAIAEALDLAEKGTEEKAEEKAIARLSMAIRALLFIDEDSRPEPPLKRPRADGNDGPADSAAVQGRGSPEDVPSPARCVCVMFLGMRGAGKTATCSVLHEVLGARHVHYDEIGATTKKAPRKVYGRELRAALTRTLVATRRRRGENGEAKPPAGEGDNLLLIDRTNILRSQRMDAIVQLQKLRWKSRGCRTLLVEFTHSNDEMGYGLDGQLSKRFGESHISLCAERIRKRSCAHHALKPSERLRTVLQKEAKAMEPVSPDEQRNFDAQIKVDVALSPPEMATEVAKAIRERGWIPNIGDCGDWSIKAELAWQLFARAEERWRQGTGTERGAWLAQCRQAQAAEKAVAKALEARALVANRGKQQEQGPFWKFDLPEVREVLLSCSILPPNFTPVESTFVRLLQLPADRRDFAKAAQEQGLDERTMETMQDALESLRGETFEVKMTKILISETVALGLVTLDPGVPCASKVPHIVFGSRPGVCNISAEDMLEKVEEEKSLTDKKTVTCTALPTPRPMKGQIQLQTLT